jgi:hypothetical protein
MEDVMCVSHRCNEIALTRLSDMLLRLMRGTEMEDSVDEIELPDSLIASMR